MPTTEATSATRQSAAPARQVAVRVEQGQHGEQREEPRHPQPALQLDGGPASGRGSVATSATAVAPAVTALADPGPSSSQPIRRLPRLGPPATGPGRPSG